MRFSAASLILCCLVLLVLPHATAAQNKPVNTTVCDVAKNPAAFDNKMVRLTATFVSNFEFSGIRDAVDKDCEYMWFTYPGSGPAASVSIHTGEPPKPRPAVELIKDRNFRRFQKYIDAQMYPREQNSHCMGCPRYEVTAVMFGQVEFAGDGPGFGHMNSARIQFELQSIEKTTAKDLAATYGAKEYSVTPVRFPTGYISGTLLAPNGRPIFDGDVSIDSVDDPPIHIEEDFSTTDEKGRFKFSVPPGKYIVSFNTFWPPSSKFPYPPTYYPSTPERNAAQIISVADNQHIKDVTLKLTRSLAPRVIPVKVLRPDGTPVAVANVWISQLSDPTTVVGTSVSHTSADGTFDLKGFEGIDYILHANKYAGLGRVSCTEKLLIRASQPIPERIQLTLSITNFDVCTNPRLDAPADSAPQK
jgi:hypothetical protein